MTADIYRYLKATENARSLIVYLPHKYMHITLCTI